MFARIETFSTAILYFTVILTHAGLNHWTAIMYTVRPYGGWAYCFLWPRCALSSSSQWGCGVVETISISGCWFTRYLQADDGEHTTDFSQQDIAGAVDISSAQKVRRRASYPAGVEGFSNFTSYYFCTLQLFFYVSSWKFKGKYYI